jgi:O-antigen/teichoic acid export membrane protein
MEGNRQSQNKSILRQILTYIPSSILPSALTLLTTAIFTRVFTTEKYGEYSYFLSISVSIRLVASMWLMQGIGRFLAPLTTEDARDRQKRVILLGVSLLTLGYLIISAAAILFAVPRLPPGWRAFIYPMAIFTVTVSLFDISNSIFASERRANEFAAFKIIDSVITFGLRILLIFVIIKGDITAMFWSMIASNAVCIPFMWYKSRLPGVLSIPSVMRSKDNWRELGPFFSFGMMMTVWQFFSILLDVGDRYVLQFLRGMSEVGIYDANYRLIAGTVSLIVAPITMALHPYLMSISGTGDKARIGNVLGVIVENMLLMGFLAVGVCAIFNRDIAFILLGEGFRGGCVIMPIVLAGTILFNIGSFAHKPFEIAMKTTPMLVLGLLSVVLNMALNFILIPIMNYIGAAVATLAAYAFYTIVIGLLGRRVIAWKIDLKRMLPDVLAMAAGCCAVYAARCVLERYVSPQAGLAVSLVLGLALTGGYFLKIAKNLKSASTRFKSA